MSDAVATPTVQANCTWSDGKMFHAVGTLAVGASPLTYAAGGIVLNFALDPLIKSQRVPVFVEIEGRAGYQYTYVPGTDITNGLLMIRQSAGSAAAFGEIPTAAIPAGVSGDTIKFHLMSLFGA